MISIALRTVRGAVNQLSSISPSPSPSYTALSLNPSTTPSYSRHADADADARTHTRSTFYTRLAALLFFLLPSFVQTRLYPGVSKPRRIHPTSWLDGLRGVASLIVYFYHFTEATHKSFLMAYGVHRDGNGNGGLDSVASSPIQLPFVRVLYAGKPMVHIFFIVSGFVLSYKPLRQIRAREYEGLQRTLASSVFRRGFRLFLPTLVSTLAIMWLRYLHLTPHEPRPSLWEQLHEWREDYSFLISLVWQWDSARTPEYDSHLWTIPIEMSFSMLLFVVVLGLSRVKSFIRLAATVGIATYCIKSGHFAGWEFMAGVAFAEIQLIQDAERQRESALLQSKEEGDMDMGDGSVPIAPSHTTPFPSSSWSCRVAKRLFQLFLLANMIFALYVIGWPAEKWDDSAVFATLLRHTPEPYAGKGLSWPTFVWFAVGAVQTVAALHQIEPLRRVFNTRPAQYLADISFALYICHGPVMKVVHSRVMPCVWSLVGGKAGAGVWARLVAWLLGLVVLSVPTVWVSDVFWRGVDVKSVELARWIERRCSIDE